MYELIGAIICVLVGYILCSVVHWIKDFLKTDSDALKDYLTFDFKAMLTAGGMLIMCFVALSIGVPV